MALQVVTLIKPAEPFSIGIKMKSRYQHINLYYIKQSRNASMKGLTEEQG